MGVSGSRGIAPAPRPSIRGTLNPLEMELVLGALSARAACNNDEVSGLNRVLRDLLLLQGIRIRPFGRISLHLARFVLSQYVNPRMRVLVLELHHFSLDRHGL